MKSFSTIFGMLICGIASAFMVTISGPYDTADEKIVELEERVAKLENIVFSTSQLRQVEAQRRLENAKVTFEHSQKLRKKGFINEAQLKNDQFAVLQAEQELELARATDDKARLGAKLDLINANQVLAQANRELEYIKKLASRGFATKFEVQRCERHVRVAERAVELAKSKHGAFDSSDNEAEKNRKTEK